MFILYVVDILLYFVKFSVHFIKALRRGIVTMFSYHYRTLDSCRYAQRSRIITIIIIIIIY